MVIFYIVTFYFTIIQSIDFVNQYIKKPRKLIVEILAFCLMPNHFHLLLRQREEGGLTKFMRKIGVGYANYFNQKYKRSGTLFQGRYKLVLVNSELHFVHLPYYIHFNPLDLTMPEWRKGEIQNYQKAVEILNSFRWSSHLDYIGKKNFPSVTQREFLLKIFGGAENYKDNVKNWLKEMELEKIKKIILE
ncbi:MAG: transposase [Candidatus Nealsonbacteria bacterium]